MDDLRAILRGMYRVQDAQKLLNETSAWAETHHVKFGLPKCGVLSPDPVELTLQDQPLPQRDTYKYLGMTLGTPTDEHDLDGMRDGFRLNENWPILKADLERRLSWITKLRGSIAVRRTAYLALVRSKLSYGIELMTRDYLTELQLFQNRALRTVAYSLPGVPAARIHDLLDLPPIYDLALSRAGGLYGALLDCPTDVGTAYDTWIDSDEGRGSTHSPFGLIQDAALHPVQTLKPPPLADWDAPIPPLDAIGRLYPSTQQVEFAYHLRTVLMENPTSWRKVDFDPDGKTLTSRYLLFTDGAFDKTKMAGGGGYHLIDRLTNTADSGGTCVYPIFASLDSEFEGLTEGLEDLTKRPPDTTTVLADSTSTLHKLRRPLKLNTLTDERVLTILDLCAHLVNVGFTLEIRWVPSHRPPTTSLLYHGNNMADIAAGQFATRPRMKLLPIPSTFWRHFRHQPMDANLRKLGKLIRQLPHDQGRTITRFATNHSRLNGWTLRMALKKRAQVLQTQTRPNGGDPEEDRTPLPTLLLKPPPKDPFDLDRLPTPADGWQDAACRLCALRPETPFHLITEHMHRDLTAFTYPNDTHLHDAVPRFMAAKPEHPHHILEFLRIENFRV
jgi:ribonuclease HI